MGTCLTREKGLTLLGFCGNGMSRSPIANLREESIIYYQPRRASKYLLLVQWQESVLAWPGWGRQGSRDHWTTVTCEFSDLIKFEYQPTLLECGDHTPELKVGITVWPIFEYPWGEQGWGILNWGPYEKIQETWSQHVEVIPQSLSIWGLGPPAKSMLVMS